MIKPMLAHKVGKKEIDFYEKVFLQRKLDGVRCIFTKDGAFSRTGKQFKNVAHLESDLEDFFKEHPFTVLDGELYNHVLKDDFEKIISLVRKQKPTNEDARDAANLVQYHVYDTIAQGPNYDVRYIWLVNHLPIARSMTLVKNPIVTSLKMAQDLHKVYLSEGYEGSMLRLNKPYEQKRSYNLQKFKDFHDTEEGIEFGCPPGKGYNYEDLADMLVDINNYIGKRATFTYFQRTKANSYRHPLFKALRNYE